MGSAQSSDTRSGRSIDESIAEDADSATPTTDRTTASRADRETQSRPSPAFQSNSSTISYHDPNRPEGGMALVHYVCRKKKRQYETCVSSWYAQEFMTGAGSLNQEEVCGEKFELYKSCVLKGIRKEVWDKQGLPPPSDSSPLALDTEATDEATTSR